MRKKTEGLLFRFTIVFIVFTVCIIGISAGLTYANQTRIYHRQCEEHIQSITEYFEKLMAADGEEFVAYQNYIIKHRDEILIPRDFTSYLPAKHEFENLFSSEYPGKTLFRDVAFDELPDEIKKAFAIYMQEYWLLTFEEARPSFGVIYTYYVCPTGEKDHMYYVIDSVRDVKVVDGIEYLLLCIDIDEPFSEHERMWEAWNTGETPSGYDYYDNEFGKTYAYYAPLYIGGEKMGVIGVDIEIDTVNKEILNNTIRQSVELAIVFAVFAVFLLLYINKKYISKLSNLRKSVARYGETKDAGIVDKIEKLGDGGDEISVLSGQISTMILELDNYMSNLKVTTKELSDTRVKAAAMDELAMKDALTGIRNKMAYDQEVRRIEWEMASGKTDFGVAMIDMNFLKRLNDTFGHEQGNKAIQKLCGIVCSVFKHSPVFRIGGDEFVVILENEDYKCVDALVAEFNEKIEESNNSGKLNQWEKISAAIGIAKYNPETDSGYDNVFKRADKAMYAKKREMRAARID